MFYSTQLSFRRVPASLAVATLIVCTVWGIASGLVGAAVVLMGVIAFTPMLRAGCSAKLSSGVITAGGTLGILIPPSVMIIVYAAVAMSAYCIKGGARRPCHAEPDLHRDDVLHADRNIGMIVMYPGPGVILWPPNDQYGN